MLPGAVDLVKYFGAVAVSPGYRLAPFFPYPAALDDCYDALLYMKSHAAELGILENQLMVGGEECGRRTLRIRLHKGSRHRRGEHCVSDAALPYD